MRSASFNAPSRNRRSSRLNALTCRSSSSAREKAFGVPEVWALFGSPVLAQGGSVELKSRIVPGVLIGGVVLAGGGSVIAAAGGSSSTQSASAAQYCPDGTPKPPSGGCNGHGGNGGNPGGPGERPGKKHKKPKSPAH